MRLKFEVDTEDLFGDSEEIYIPTFEDLARSGLKQALKTEIISNISKESIKEQADKISEEIEGQIEKKLSELIDENLVLTDNYGKVKFVGSVEDYMKKQIDEKILRRVDFDGRTIEGCTTSGLSWLEWSIKNEIKSQIIEIHSASTRQANSFCKNELDKSLKVFMEKTLKGKIVSKLEELGVVDN